MGFPDSSVGKECTCNARDPSLLPGSGRSEEGIGYTAVFLSFPYVSADKESICNARDRGSIPRLGMSLGEGKGILIIMCLGVDLFQSVQFSLSVMSDSLQPHESQHARPPCPSPTPRVHSNLHPSSRWYHPAISPSVIPFSSCPQSLPASEFFPIGQFFPWGGQSTGVSALALFLPKNTQGWSPSEWTDWISLQSKGLARVFSNTTVQKHQFFSAQLSS